MIGPNYKDQTRTTIKTTNDTPSEGPHLLEVKAIAVHGPLTRSKRSMTYAIIATVAMIAIVVIIIGSMCGITGKCSRSSSTKSSLMVSSNAPTPTTVYIRSPSSNQFCGDGVYGNGNCSDSKLCCSSFGYCGTTEEYCSKDACGNGARGSGNCTNPALCCSASGYCGSTSEYCG